MNCTGRTISCASAILICWKPVAPRFLQKPTMLPSLEPVRSATSLTDMWTTSCGFLTMKSAMRWPTGPSEGHSVSMRASTAEIWPVGLRADLAGFRDGCCFMGAELTWPPPA